MSARLTTMQELNNRRMLNLALILCAMQVGVILSAILFGFLPSHPIATINRISALSWLILGGGSILISIVGFAGGKKSLSSFSVVAICILIFILCAFRFALV